MDDEWTNRTVFEENFNDRFRIITVDSGAKALEVLKSEPIACLVTDQRMPGVSGNELLESAKKLHPQTIRVVVTAYSDLDPILKAVNDGLVARYIVKPWMKEDLENILSWAVDAYSLGWDVQKRLLLSERFITLGGMASSVIHEIRNQLGYPKANASYLQGAAEHASELGKLVEAHAAELTPGARAAIADLAIEIRSLADDSVHGVERIEDILNSFRRVLKGDAADERVSDPREAIRHSLVLLRTLSKDVGIDYVGPERLPPVLMGGTELIQILVNLGRNAIQAFPVQTRGQVTMSIVEEGDLLHFSVIDDGPGMTADILAKVGGEFFTTKEDGTGLGVAQCRRLIANAGGDLRIDSTPAKGTSVRFSLKKA